MKEKNAPKSFGSQNHMTKTISNKFCLINAFVKGLDRGSKKLSVERFHSLLGYWVTKPL